LLARQRGTHFEHSWEKQRTQRALQGRVGSLVSAQQGSHALNLVGSNERPGEWNPGPVRRRWLRRVVDLAKRLDGGGIVEAGLKYGVGFKTDVKSAILAARDNYSALRAKVLDLMPDGERMCWEYERVIRQLLLQRPSGS